MIDAMQRASLRFLLLAVPIFLRTGIAGAENIDPANDGSKYAWAENLGWLNARPGGPGGPGVQVSDSDLTGWAWSENAGWISLSCTNLSCAAGSFGVTNDGCGNLTGFAWSENAGWINFAPNPVTCGGDPTCGVKISPTTGIFSGRAWSENAGWITFSSAGPNPYRVTTSWRRAVPAGSIALTVTRAGGSNVLLSWTAVSGAATYDVVRGGLSTLHGSTGTSRPRPRRASSAARPGRPSPPAGRRARETVTGSSCAAATAVARGAMAVDSKMLGSLHPGKTASESGPN